MELFFLMICALHEGISHNNLEANLIKAASLMIWDEALMIKRHSVEAVDRTFRDLLRCDSILREGECIVMGGDFV